MRRRSILAIIYSNCILYSVFWCDLSLREHLLKANEQGLRLEGLGLGELGSGGLGLCGIDSTSVDHS